MISVLLRIVLGIGVISYFIVIIHFLKRGELELKYSMIWIAAGVCMLILIIFPNILPCLIKLLGFESNMNGLFSLAIAFLIMISMILTSIVSKQTRRINKLAQQIAILENRIDKLEKCKF